MPQAPKLLVIFLFLKISESWIEPDSLLPSHFLPSLKIRRQEAIQGQDQLPPKDHAASLLNPSAIKLNALR